MIGKLLENPIATAGAILAPIAGAVGFLDPLLAFVLSNVEALFTVGSVVGFSIAPRVEWIPTELATGFALAMAAIFVGVRLENLVEKFAERFL